MSFEHLSFEHLTPATATWLIAALVGLYFAVHNLDSALADREAARKVRNGLYAARMVVTQGSVFRNIVWVAIFVWWTLLGVVFAFFDAESFPLRGGGALGLVVTVIGWSVIGAQEVTERRQLDALVIKAAREEAARLVASQLEESERLAPLTAQVERMADSMDDTEQRIAEDEEKADARAAAPRAEQERAEDKHFGDQRRELEDEHRAEDDAHIASNKKGSRP